MAQPERSSIEEAVVRREKLRAIQAAGVDPYPATAKRTHAIAEAIGDFNALAAAKTKVTVCGRLKAVRGHGGACFADLEDGTDRIQLHLRKDVLGASAYEFFEQRVDRGDFLQVTGTLLLTKMGQKTIEATELRLLTKALRGLPDKWHGLTDVEIRYRQRELDLITNAEVRGIFKKRSLLVKVLRDFFHEEGFMEVETPMLQPIAGGASARPFVTHHHALDIDLYLRVAPELYLKRLVVGGFERVFEIGRCFRNEGIDHSHNPEFSSIEFYQAYADYRDLMALTERLLPLLAETVSGGTSVVFDGKTIDFSPGYSCIAFRDAILEYCGIDIDTLTDRAALAKEAESHGVQVTSSDDRGAILDNLYKKHVRPKLINPTFIIDHPTGILPLAKRIPGNPGYVESFQLVLGGGVELIKAFSELNDPIDQRTRFSEQERLREGGDEEAQRMDDAFLDALEIGMPPTAGFGMGIDRLVAVLTGSHSLKEVILFPTLRPEQKAESQER